MKKGFFKKLFATLSIALTATVVAGVASIETTNTSAATTGVSSAMNFDDGTLDSANWEVTNSTKAVVTGGQLVMTAGATDDGSVVLMSTGTYENFTLEYDMQIQYKAASVWVGVALFGSESSFYGHAGNEFIYINQWGAVTSLNFTFQGEAAYLMSPITPFTETQTDNFVPLHVKLTAQGGTVTLTFTSNGQSNQRTIATGVDTLGKVGIPAGLNTTVAIDNVQITNLDQGTVDPASGVIYTDFSAAVDTTDWTITNANTTAVSGGQLVYNTGDTNDGDAIVSVGSYTNFTLEYDIYFKEKAVASWYPIAMFGGNSWYGSGKLLYINRWGAIDALPAGSITAFLPGVTPYEADQTTGFDTLPLHIKLTAQDGTVILTMSKNGTTATHEIGTGWTTTGQVGIPSTTSTSFAIDNLVLVNTDTYKNYVVSKKAPASVSVSATAGQTVSGELLTGLGDMTNKSVSFTSNTPGFTVNESTGEWQYTAGTENGTYTLSYTATINDLVYDGWVYPIGDDGIYTTNGTVVVTVTGGTEPVTPTLGNFTSSVGTAWSGTSASYTEFGNGNYIATDDAYSFTDTEVLVFETNFTVNEILTQSVDDYTKFNLTFIYGADSAAGVYTDASNLLGHTLLGNNHAGFAGANGHTQNNANANSAWINLLKSGKLTYYVFPDGSSSIFFVNPATNADGRQAYITADDAAARIVSATKTSQNPIDSATASARVADRSGYIGWAFAGTESINFTYTSMRVGKMTITAGETAAGSITTHDESKVTWLAQHTQKDGETGGGTGSGSTGGGDTGGGESGSATGVTTYTQFASGYDTTNWEITNTSTVTVSGGKLNYATLSSDDGKSAIVTKNTYENFILEYDVYIQSKPTNGWMPIAFFGASSNYYGHSGSKFLHINTWGAVAATGFDVTPFIPGITPFGNEQSSGFSSSPVHIKLVAQDGTVTLYMSQDGSSCEHQIATGINTVGKIGIPAFPSTTFSIDNLVLINSDEYKDYTVEKMTLANSSIQANAGENLNGDLLQALKDAGYDLSTKSVSFRSRTDGFFIGSDGTWQYTASTVNGSYTLNYVITVNDLVLDGWVYPLGDKGVYTIEGSIAVDVMGGTDSGDGTGGGSGETAELPTVVGENVAEHIKGKIQDESFIVDTKTFSIISIKLNNENVKLAAYTLTEVEEGIQVTFKGDFMALLSVGDNEFIIATAKGTTNVIVRVTELQSPVLSGETTVTMKDNVEKDATFTIDTDELEIISVYRIGATMQLNDSAYTYVDGVLTLKKEYLATLEAGQYTFQITTEGGSVDVFVTIEEVFPPMLLSDGATTFTKGITENVTYELDTMGEEITQIVRTGASKALGANAYAYDETAYTLTFNASYLATLTAGAHEFTISTIGGEVIVTITVIDATAPTCAEDSKSAMYGVATDVTFNVNVYGQKVTAIVRTGASYGLGTNAYSFANNTLTLVGDYVALLPVGSNEFTLETLGGTVKLYVVVDGSQLSAPTVSLNGNKATWTAVAGATGYTYKIGENGVENTVTSIIEVTLTHNQVLYVKANGNGTTSKDSEWAISTAYVAPTLATPTVSISGNRVSWSAVTNATTYTYKINDGVEQTTNNTYVDLKHNQTIVIKASGDNANYLDSNWSSAITYTAPTLATPVVSLNGNVASWVKVEGAESYTYKLNGGEEETTTKLSVELKHGQYIEVKANGNDKTSLDSAYCTPVTYYASALETPDVKLTDNVASWTKVEGATKYGYTINGEEGTTETTSITIYHNDILVVWAVGNGETSLDSAKSAAVTYTASRLTTPDVKLTENVASWTAIDGVTYKYTINGGEAETATGNSVTLTHNQKLVVWAVGDNKTSLDSLESAEVTYTATTLEMSKVTLSGNVASWTKVEGAESYTYKLNGGEEETTTNLSVELKHGQYIEVKANGNDKTTLTSGWSVPVTFTAPTLETPVVSLNDNVASWTVDENATKYVYKIGLSGEEKDADGNSVILKHGEAIYVMAVGNGETSLSSGWSQAQQYKAPTLATPSVGLSGNRASWTKVDGAMRYAYKINNGVEDYTENCYVDLANGQKIVVKALGNGETSLDSGWSSAVTYHGAALAMPVVTITNDVATWTEVENATTYIYRIGEYGVETENTSRSVNLIHGQTIYVKAIGNGETILDSEWSVGKTYIAPTLETPVVSLNGNKASWTMDEGVSYVYKIGVLGESIPATSGVVTLKHDETIYVMAVGNGKTSLSSGWSQAVTYTATTLATPVVSLNDNVASWTKVDGATSYVYKISGSEEKTTNELSVTLTHGQYIVVKAVGDSATTLESAWATSDIYVAPTLNTPEVKVEDNVASWAAVTGATRYAYMINGGEVQYTNGLSVTLTHGQSIVVKALGDGETNLDGEWTTVETYTATTLATPVVSLNGNKASWTADDTAAKYVYKIGLNGEEKDATGNSVTLKHNETVYVKAVGNGETTLTSGWSEGVKYTATTLETPVVSLNGNVASWNAVDNASGYVYTINGSEEQTTSERSVTLTHGQYIIVKAVGNSETTLTSSWSVPVTFTAPTLETPVVSLNDNVVSWTADDNATKYVYKIGTNGEEKDAVGNSVALKHGETIFVKAIGGNVTLLDSSWSMPVTFTAPTLETPVVSLNGNVASWNAVDNASGYVYTINGGEEQTTSELSVTLTHGQYIVVKAVGNGETTLTSGWSNTVTYTATTLATPVVSLNGNVASWNAVDNASGYAYSINGGEEQTTNELSITLEDGQTLLVKAVGNEETTLTSEWSNSVTYTKPAEGGGEGGTPDQGEVEGDGIIGGEEEDNPFEEEIPEDEAPDDNEGGEGDDNEDEGNDENTGGGYDEEFTGSVKPSEDSYDIYMEGLANGGKVAGCTGSVSVLAGLPVVGIIAMFIRKKKEN